MRPKPLPVLFCLTAALAALCVAELSALDLKPQTLAAFDRYVRLTEERIAGQTSGKAPFLWIDRQPEAQRRDALQRLSRGQVVVAQIETRDGNARIDVSDGLIHHWIGTVLLSGATLDRVTAFVQGYQDYPRHFAPMIERATIRSRDGDRFVVSMRTSTKKIITVVLDGDYAIEYRRVDPGRMFTRSITTNITEVANPGQRTERHTPAEKGTGYLWRLNTYCSFEMRPEGTYEQCESISLTRGIPVMLSLLVKPFVTSIPRETLEFTLGQVRKGVAR